MYRPAEIATRLTPIEVAESSVFLYLHNRFNSWTSKHVCGRLYNRKQYFYIDICEKVMVMYCLEVARSSQII